MQRAKLLLATGLTALLAAGCGSGRSGSAAAPAPVGVSKLDMGGYRTTPGTEWKPTFEQARLAEGDRLAGYLPLPMDIDPRLEYQYGNGVTPQFAFAENADGTGLFVDNLDTLTPGFIAGFNVQGQSDQSSEISIQLEYSVLIFKDSASASAATQKLADTQFAHNADFRPTDIAGHPEARAAWELSTDELQTFTTTNAYVLYISVSDQAMANVSASSLPELTDLARKSIEAVPPSLNGFHPTPSDQLTDMKPDHDGMIGRSLFRAANTDDNPIGVYDRRSALHLSERPAADKDLYARTGMDWMVTNAGRLYRTRDDQAARDLLDDRSTVHRFYRSADPPKNLTDARCIERKEGSGNIATGVPRFHCVVASGRYVAEVWSDQIVDVHQRISAQYALLTKK
jgi:hypothetical protein